MLMLSKTHIPDGKLRGDNVPMLCLELPVFVQRYELSSLLVFYLMLSTRQTLTVHLSANQVRCCWGGVVIATMKRRKKKVEQKWSRSSGADK